MTVDAFEAVGASYSIDSRLIRTEDRLESFASVDSWMLGGGTEKLNQWLVRRGLNRAEEIKPETVLELVRIVQGARAG